MKYVGAGVGLAREVRLREFVTGILVGVYIHIHTHVHICIYIYVCIYVCTANILDFLSWCVSWGYK